MAIKLAYFRLRCFMKDLFILYYKNNNSNLYSTFLNTQKCFTWGQEAVTNRTKQKWKADKTNKQDINKQDMYLFASCFGFLLDIIVFAMCV